MASWKAKFVVAVSLMCIDIDTSSAELIMSIDPAQLEVQSTGGLVFQDVDLRIRHEGAEPSTFSNYELQLDPVDPAISVVAGPITDSDFAFALHASAGTGPYSISGTNFVDFSASTGTEDLLARFTLQIDTSTIALGNYSLNPTLISAFRGTPGPGFTNIGSEVTVLPANLQVSAVPEPRGLAVILAGVSACFVYVTRKRKEIAN